MSDSATVEGFRWDSFLEQEQGIFAAPVYLFRHCPLCEFWTKLCPNIKVEVPNFDSDSRYRVYWVATVMEFAGYMAKFRYEGDDESKSFFWMNFCNRDVHPVGWCSVNSQSLSPPMSMKERDWKEYLFPRLVGSVSLPDNFRRRVQEAVRSQFKKNMLLEMIDKSHLSRTKVARIVECIGGRLRIIYKDDPEVDFWVHEQSELIHPIGWSMLVGHDMDADEAYKKQSLQKIQESNFRPEDCDPFMFKSFPLSEDDVEIRVGMKLEAIDPLRLSSIAVASIVKILKKGYIMVGIDGQMAPDQSDSFCYHRSSASIFPAGFCQSHGIPLTPPPNYKGEFHWDKYLRETNSEFAPIEMFSRLKVENRFEVNMKLEAVDLMEPRLVCVATVVAVVDRLIRIRFDGWDSDYDQWIDCESPDIYPIGFCELVGYSLEPPNNPDSQIPRKKRKGKKKKSRQSLEE